MRLILVLLFIMLVSCTTEDTVNISKLGSDKFTPETWLNSDQEKRGKMVESFFQQYDVQGKSTQELYRLLGESTAYYEYDEFPAYFIGPTSVESIFGEGYVLAFPIDRKSGKIRKFVIEPKIE